MTTPGQPPRGRSVLGSFKFWAATLTGSLAAVLTAALAPLPLQLGLLGVLASIVAGLVLVALEREAEREEHLRQLLADLKLPLALTPHHGLFAQYRAFAEALAELAKQTDPALQEFALLKLSSLAEQVQALAQGKVVFHGTEAWRTVYEKLLTSPEVKRYHSVAWVKTADYWQDQPGRQSMRLNFEAIERGVRIERIVILPAAPWAWASASGPARRGTSGRRSRGCSSWASSTTRSCGSPSSWKARSTSSSRKP